MPCFVSTGEDRVRAANIGGDKRQKNLVYTPDYFIRIQIVIVIISLERISETKICSLGVPCLGVPCHALKSVVSAFTFLAARRDIEKHPAKAKGNKSTLR